MAEQFTLVTQKPSSTGSHYDTICTQAGVAFDALKKSKVGDRKEHCASASLWVIVSSF